MEEEDVFNYGKKIGGFLPRKATQVGAFAANKGVGKAFPVAVSSALAQHYKNDVKFWHSIELKSKVDKEVKGIKDRFYSQIVSELSENNRLVEGTVLEYETKLTRPAELTLAHLYDREDVDNSKAEELTDLVVSGLIEGDMRDSLNDGEVEDFHFKPDIDEPAIKREAAEDVRDEAWNIVKKKLNDQNRGVRESRQEVVDISEGHQEEDEDLREIVIQWKDEGLSDRVIEEINEDYRDVEFEDTGFFRKNEEIREIPYFGTQYERVGILYEGMTGMYEEAGLPLDTDFKKSMVAMSIAGQIWLDDIDDLEDDLKNNQMTPVTSEIILADTAEEAYENILNITEDYFDAAEHYAREADSDLSLIGIQYMRDKKSRKEVKETVESAFKQYC